ncbi:MAG: outer membrane protein assembly factor BamB family protein, partial [Planctomycetota bacterium]
MNALSASPCRTAAVALAVLIAFAASPSAGETDWNEWRGPNRSGAVVKSPPLLDAWPEAGPKKLWESADQILGADPGGFGSPVVAGGRLFVLETPQHPEPLKTRTLDEKNLKLLGWQAAMPPADVLAKIEAARNSDERAAMKDRKKITAWARKWASDNLDADARKKFGRFASGRLTAGKSAIPVPLLEKLAGIKDKEFADAAALDAWLTANGFEGDVRKKVAARFPATRKVGEDVVFCLDAASGKTLWKVKYPGVARGHASSSTPCVTDGKCYIIGSDADAYCLSAETGEKIWHRKIGTGEKNASFAVIDGVA